MKRRIGASIVVCAAAALLLSGCTATVSGRVVGHTSGEPIAGALVTVSGKSTRTDASGAFVLNGLEKRTAQGAVVASGYPSASFDTDLSQRDTSETVRVADAALTVGLNELAIEPQELTTATITLDGVTVVLGQQLKNLAPGAHILTVSAPDHEDYSGQIALVPGQNSILATLSLTPMATYHRFWAAAQYHHNDISYKYIHPDERKHLTLKKWKSLSGGVETISVKFGAVRMKASWKSVVTKKTYKNVAEIDRTEKYEVTGRQYSDFGKVYTVNYSQHWVQLRGIWYIVHKAKL